MCKIRHALSLLGSQPEGVAAELPSRCVLPGLQPCAHSLGHSRLYRACCCTWPSWSLISTPKVPGNGWVSGGLRSPVGLVTLSLELWGDSLCPASSLCGSLLGAALGLGSPSCRPEALGLWKLPCACWLCVLPALPGFTCDTETCTAEGVTRGHASTHRPRAPPRPRLSPGAACLLTSSPAVGLALEPPRTESCGMFSLSSLAHSGGGSVPECVSLRSAHLCTSSVQVFEQQSSVPPGVSCVGFG